LAIHFRSDDLEINQQTLFVFNYFRLSRGDLEVLGITLALIANENSKGVRNRWLNEIIRERIVREDIALMEVAEVEFCLWVDGDGRGNKWYGDSFAVFQIGEGATNGVSGGDLRSGEVGWDEGPLSTSYPFIEWSR